MHNAKIRAAIPSDASDIHALLKIYAMDDQLLPRSTEEIIDNIRDFYVVSDSKSLLGCCSLKIYTDELAEIRSLAVSSEAKGLGYGKALLDQCEEDGKRLMIKSIFALTYIPDFFTKSGFKIVDKETLPHKIWKDCFNCPKFPNCGEIAVIKSF